MGVWSIIYSTLIIGFILVAIISLFYERKAGISPTPVLPWVRKKALKLLTECNPPQNVKNIADLGCGWGGMIGKLRKQYPSAKVTGYEISPCPYYFSKLRFLPSGKKVAIKDVDFFKDTISGYDIVFCYLSPQHMEKLKPQLLGLKKGSLVVACSFLIEGWEPVATTTVWSLVNIPVCVYRI